MKAKKVTKNKEATPVTEIEKASTKKTKSKKSTSK